MSDTSMPHLEQLSERPWGARGTTGPVFAGNVTFENVSFHVKRKPILQNISLELKAGKIACLLGPSGCGKTTLLRLAAGVARPSSGRILLDQMEVAGPQRFLPPEKRNIGLMFQDFALFPHMTALQNVAYGLYALKKPEAMEVASLALARVGLSGIAHRYPAMLSGGEQQRVALARAIVPRPQVILMDEPFSGLDQRLRESVRGETLAVLRETRATCLLVTHDPQEALAVADEIFLMRSGRLLQQGSPEDLMTHPKDASVARFFRNYNEFSGHIQNGAVSTPLGNVPAPGFQTGEPVAILVPPKAIVVTEAKQGTRATLLESRFMGEDRHLRFAIQGHPSLIDVTTDITKSFSIATTYGLAISQGHAHVFAQDEPQS